MSNLTDTLTVWQREDTRADASLWVCEWQGATPGEFFVRAGHYYEARQTAKRVIRDHMAVAGKVRFEVCAAGLLDRGWLALAQRQQRVQSRVCGSGAVTGENILAGNRPLTLQAKPTGG